MALVLAVVAVVVVMVAGLSEDDKDKRFVDDVVVT